MGGNQGMFRNDLPKEGDESKEHPAGHAHVWDKFCRGQIVRGREDTCNVV